MILEFKMRIKFIILLFSHSHSHTHFTFRVASSFYQHVQAFTFIYEIDFYPIPLPSCAQTLLLLTRESINGSSAYIIEFEMRSIPLHWERALQNHYEVNAMRSGSLLKSNYRQSTYFSALCWVFYVDCFFSVFFACINVILININAMGINRIRKT